jgi:hypothetical protein
VLLKGRWSFRRTSRAWKECKKAAGTLRCLQ